MKKFLNIALLAILAFSGVACSKVTAGNVGIKVQLLGEEKGVNTTQVLGPGRYWIGMNEELYIFPTFQQNYTWTQSQTEQSPVDESLTFQTKEGMAVNVDVGISYSVDPDKVPVLFQKYRRGVSEITDTVLRNAVRDALNDFGSQYTVEENYSTKKIELFNQVKSRVAEQFASVGIKVENVYLINTMRLPANVTAALNSKIEATQRAQQRENELREAEAQAKKEIAKAEGEAKAMLARAEAESKANKLKLQTLTKELIQYEAVQKWTGELPQYVSGTGGLPFIGQVQPNKSEK